MEIKFATLAFVPLFFITAGCATEVRVGAPNREVAAGAAVGAPVGAYPVPDATFAPPPAR